MLFFEVSTRRVVSRGPPLKYDYTPPSGVSRDLQWEEVAKKAEKQSNLKPFAIIIFGFVSPSSPLHYGKWRDRFMDGTYDDASTWFTDRGIKVLSIDPDERIVPGAGRAGQRNALLASGAAEPYMPEPSAVQEPALTALELHQVKHSQWEANLKREVAKAKWGIVVAPSPTFDPNAGTSSTGPAHPPPVDPPQPQADPPQPP